MVAEFSFYPFDAGPGSVVFEAEWVQFMRWMRTNGILSLNTPLNDTTEDLAVTADVNLTVKIAPGEAFLLGTYWNQSGDYEYIAINPNNSGEDRIDLLVIEVDFDANDTRYVVVEGIPDPAPVAPTPTQNFTVFQLPLAEIYVTNGSASINSGDITDVRVKSTQG